MLEERKQSSLKPPKAFEGANALSAGYEPESVPIGTVKVDTRGSAHVQPSLISMFFTTQPAFDVFSFPSTFRPFRAPIKGMSCCLTQNELHFVGQKCVGFEFQGAYLAAAANERE